MKVFDKAYKEVQEGLLYKVGALGYSGLDALLDIGDPSHKKELENEKRRLLRDQASKMGVFEIGQLDGVHHLANLGNWTLAWDRLNFQIRRTVINEGLVEQEESTGIVMGLSDIAVDLFGPYTFPLEFPGVIASEEPLHFYRVNYINNRVSVSPLPRTFQTYEQVEVELRRKHILAPSEVEINHAYLNFLAGVRK